MKYRSAYFTHPEFKDVFIEVIKIRFIGSDYVKAKIAWHNKGQSGKPWPMFFYENNKKIPKTVWRKFKPLTDPY